ncbi:MAG: hypothetical protein Tsb0013_07690 [Phycisphaerales bacterium]
MQPRADEHEGSVERRVGGHRRDGFHRDLRAVQEVGKFRQDHGLAEVRLGSEAGRAEYIILIPEDC